MMTRRQSFFVLFTFAVLWNSTAHANLYVQPRAGAVIPLNGGDTSYSLGAAVGYRWTSFFATEGTYSRLFGSGSSADGDMLMGEGIVSVPGLGFLTPYGSLGIGYLHLSVPGNDVHETMYLFGTGVAFEPLSFLTMNLGVRYAMIDGRGDLLEPTLALGLHF